MNSDESAPLSQEELLGIEMFMKDFLSWAGEPRGDAYASAFENVDQWEEWWHRSAAVREAAPEYFERLASLRTASFEDKDD